MLTVFKGLPQGSLLLSFEQRCVGFSCFKILSLLKKVFTLFTLFTFVVS